MAKLQLEKLRHEIKQLRHKHLPADKPAHPEDSK
jgi:hypothetical protein